MDNVTPLAAPVLVEGDEMGRRDKPKEGEELPDEDSTEEIRIDHGKKKRKPWKANGRRKKQGQSELDPLWEIRPKR